MNIRERIVTIMMMMSVHGILVPASASGAKIGKTGITDETRDRVRKLHEKAKDAKWEMLDAKHRGTIEIQNSFAREVVNPVINKSNGETSEDRLLQQEFVTAPAFCEDSDPEFDGVVCLIPGYPSSEFTTALVGCPLNTESAREFFQCKDGCLVYAGDFENEDFCTSCTLCSDNDIGFSCDNIASGECAAYDCRTGSCGGSTGNPPPPPPPPPTRSPTPFPTPFPTPIPVFNPPPPPPPPPPTPLPNPSPFGNPPFEQIENDSTPSNFNPPKSFEGDPPFSGASTCRLYNPISLSLLGTTVTLMMLRLQC